MIIMKCDRCGGNYSQYNLTNDEDNPNGMILANSNVGNKSGRTTYSHNIIDLCPSCVNELTNWLKMEVKE